MACRNLLHSNIFRCYSIQADKFNYLEMLQNSLYLDI